MLVVGVVCRAVRHMVLQVCRQMLLHSHFPKRVSVSDLRRYPRVAPG